MKPPTSIPPRPVSLRQAFVPLALAVGALLAIAGAVQAALPEKGARFLFHDHETAGKNWHVEFRIDPKNPKKIKTLVAYSQVCRATVAKQNVPISDGGAVTASGTFKGGGAWGVEATFEEPTKIVGTMGMTSKKCDTGVLSYPNEDTGDGHTEHGHGGGHDGHVGSKHPDLDSATPRQRRQAAALHRGVLRTWSGVTVGEAARRGFIRGTGKKFPTKLGLFHVYNHRYENDGRIFDARRPEALVFWRRPDGPPLIMGPMFRVAPGKRPRFGGPIPIYHGHESKSGKVPSQMTHVWMAKSLKSAWALCLPAKQLTRYNPAFEYTPGMTNHKHIGEAC